MKKALYKSGKIIIIFFFTNQQQRKAPSELQVSSFIGILGPYGHQH